MQTFYDLEAIPRFDRKLVVTVGKFDGLHAGHQAVIRHVLTEAAKAHLPSAILAFHPHPLAFLAPERCPPTLTPLKKKIEILRELRVDIAVFVRFNAELANMSPEAFVKNILIQKFQAQHVIVGYDWQFGKNRSGNADTLKVLGKQYQFDVTVIPPTEIDGTPVHSTRIQDAIANGQTDMAERLLNRRYSIIGEITRGEGLGRKIGFPTANLDVGDQMLPPRGVYVIQAELDGRRFNGVLNMGTRPTFDGMKFQVEAHLFDFDEMVYGKEIEVIFLRKIRDERRFPSPQALIEQIQRDIEAARDIVRET